MTQRLILHIGHPKTGTTTLQKTLKASRPSLLDAGILHPNSGRHHNHKVLLPYLISRTSVMRQLESNPSEVVENSHKSWNHVLEEVSTFKPHTIILSSEQLFRDMGNDALKNLNSRLKSLASEIAMVAYLREPASLALSRAQHHMRKSQPNFTLPQKNYYRSILEPYNTSDIGSLKVHVFDRRTLKSGDIVEDFFAQHVPDFAPARLSRRKDENTTFSAEAMALIQEVHRKERSFPWDNASLAIENADRELHGFARPDMHDHVRNAIQTRASDLDWLKDEFDLEFPRIDTGTMPTNEANRICEALDRVDDMCVVDADRKAALWSATCKNHTPMRRLLRRIWNKG